MTHLNTPIDFAEVQKFAEKFQFEYPNLALLIELDEVANWLAQPHIRQWDCNCHKSRVERFKLGLFADWVKQNELVEVKF